MNWFKRKNIEPETVEKTTPTSDMYSSASEPSFRLKDLLDGSIFTKESVRKHYLYVLLLVLLAFMYIDNRYYTEKQMSEIAQLEKKLVDRKYESLTISSQLIQMSRQSQIVKTIEEKGLGLHESVAPAIKIE